MPSIIGMMGYGVNPVFVFSWTFVASVVVILLYNVANMVFDSS